MEGCSPRRGRRPVHAATGALPGTVGLPKNLRPMSTDSEFLQLLHDYDPGIQELAREARALVLSVAPHAHQDVEKAWGGYLLFKQGADAGNTVCWLSAHNRHVSLGFSQGTELPDPAGLLEGTGKRQRHVKLKGSADVGRPELRQLLVTAWERQPAPAELEGALERIREICRAFPGTSEKQSHGHPTFFVGKKSFAVFGLYAPSVAFKAEPAHGLDLAGDSRFFPTPYMARNGWWSLRLEGETDWSEVRQLLLESYRQVAPRKLLAELAP